jgi:integrase
MGSDPDNGPATQQRPGPGTEGVSLDATPSVQPLPSPEDDVTRRHEPIVGHPGFYRHGNRVAFKYRLRSGRVRWGSAANLREAKRRRAELQTDARRGQITGPTERFDTYARAWIDSYPGRTSRGLRAATRDGYRIQLERFAIPFFGGMTLGAITPVDVREYTTHVASEIRKRTGRDPSRNTVRLALAPVKALLATARDDGLIPADPAARVRLLVPDSHTSDSERVKAWTPEELSRLVAELDGHARLLACFLVETGLRRGELLELRWSDVDLGHGTLTVNRTIYKGQVTPPKSRYGRRRLRLSDVLGRELWQLRKDTHARDTDLVFRNGQGSRLKAEQLVADVLRPAAQRANVPWLGLHAFRHTCATSLFREGWNAKQVQVWLGHHSPAFTLATYVHLLPEDLPEPPSIGARLLGIVRPECDPNVTQTPRNAPNSTRPETADLLAKAR